MMFQRGIKSNLQFSGLGESRFLSIMVLCSRQCRTPIGYKGPPIRTTCPFMMHFIRKSVYMERDAQKQQMMDNFSTRGRGKKKHVTLSEAQVDEFDNEERQPRSSMATKMTRSTLRTWTRSDLGYKTQTGQWSSTL